VFMSEEAVIGGMGISFAVAWAVLLVGLAVFQRCQARFGDEL